MKAQRFESNPIINPDSGKDLGGNINGPSLILAPSWLENPLGKYYLYFAHHKGSYIRLAYSDELKGPWRVHEPGTLRLEDSFCYNHIASPDVHVDNEKREIRLYYHGWVAERCQRSKVAVSKDGIAFSALPEVLGEPYFKVFQWGGYHYALGMPGVFYRSKDGLTEFEEGPTLFTEDMRHAAFRLEGNTLEVYYSNAFDCPEQIFRATIDLTPDWMEWKESHPVTVLEPEMEYEGAEMPLEPSARGLVMGKVRQLRDPGIFREGDDSYLLYSVAGEYGIGIAKLLPD
jgi:hypothetical protein